MSVQFEEENKYNFSYRSPEVKGITGWMIKKEIVKDEDGAKTLMIIISVICLVLTFVKIFIL
jgi:hypothetical protein